MTSFRAVLSLSALAGVLAASPVSAQTGGRVSASINFGVQGGSGDFTQRLTPTIYDEAAVIGVAQDYSTGALFDVGADVLLFGNMGVGLHYSRTSGDGDAVIAAEIPDPVFFDRPRAAAATASGLEHSEDAVHLQFFYRFDASPKMDITVGVGPTFFSVKQQLIETVDVVEPTPTITPRVVEASDSPVGVNFGVDATYMVTDNFGAGVLLRYATASADLATAGGSAVSLDAGGFQFAGGIRLRF
jgi:hypothetical protein